MKTRTSSSSTNTTTTTNNKNTQKCISIGILNSSFAFVVICLLLPTIVTCFNFENRLPILKQGQPGSYFGYSIAEHVEVLKDESEKKW